MSIKETAAKPTTRHRNVISPNIIKHTTTSCDDDDDDEDERGNGEQSIWIKFNQLPQRATGDRKLLAPAERLLAPTLNPYGMLFMGIDTYFKFIQS